MAVWGSSGCSTMARSAASSVTPAARSATGAASVRAWRTVAGWRAVPTSWRMMPSRPSTFTVPAGARSSPAMSRSSVVLPTPLAPTSAAWSRSPTRNETSSRSCRPPGRVHERWLTWMLPTRAPPYDPGVRRARVVPVAVAEAAAARAA